MLQRVAVGVRQQSWRIGALAEAIASRIFNLARRLSDCLTKSSAKSVLAEGIAIGCFLALLWTGIILGLYHEYNAAETEAAQSTGNLAQAFEESTRRSIGEIDQTLLSARAFYAALGAGFNFNEWARDQIVRDKKTAAVAMADSKGQVFADTLPIPPNTSIADRPHFLVQMDPTRDNLFISRPVHGRVSGQETIQFTRKLLGPHGEFAGVTVFSLGCAELSRFYEAIDLAGGFVALLSSDGTILARGPYNPGLIGSHSAANDLAFRAAPKSRSSVIYFRSPHDGLDKIVSVRRLQDYPLTVLVGINNKAVFRQVWPLGKHVVFGGGVVTIAISLIGLFWVRQKRRSVEAQRALTITLETISQGIMMVNPSGHAPVINRRALDLLGLPHGAGEAMRGFAAARAIDLASRDGASPLNTSIAANDKFERSSSDTQLETVREDGAIIEVRTHRLDEGGFVQTYTDVSEQRLADAQVRYLAHHDTLTGLANRAQLRQRMQEMLGRNPTEQSLTAFLIIDLDGFKGVNDTLGHDAGDVLLVEVARRLKTLVRDEDLVARLGGDEFVIMTPGLSDRDTAITLARRVLRQMADPAQVGSQQVSVGASIGIAYYPRDGEDGDVLFKHADIALYCAKTDGRGMFRCFDAGMVQAANDYRFLEGDLRRALEQNALEVHFQPKFSSATFAIIGFEALARWRHPSRGYISPDTFIHIAEGCGLINRLGLWIIEQACATAVAWPPERAIAVSVNVSLVQIREAGLPEGIAAILDRTGLAAELLEIEVTESVMAEDNQGVLKTLDALKRMGIRIALDDFGTGYSSLSYLQRFSFDKIKIDKSFVQGQLHDKAVRVILEAILGMCRNLGLTVVAEGVETQQQLDLLREMGCTEFQGFLLGRPMPADEVNGALRENARATGRHGAATSKAQGELNVAS